MEIIYVSLDVGIPGKKIQFYTDSKQSIDQIQLLCDKYSYILECKPLTRLDVNQAERIIEVHVMELLKNKIELQNLNNQVQIQLNEYYDKKAKITDASKAPNKKTVTIKGKKKTTKVLSDSD
jgi:hypothetical protein